ncbi:hypothetical protein ACVWYN_003097 [Pedobacter sp. UYP24]
MCKIITYFPLDSYSRFPWKPKPCIVPGKNLEYLPIIFISKSHFNKLLEINLYCYLVGTYLIDSWYIVDTSVDVANMNEQMC